MLDLHRLRLLRELHHRGTLAAVAQALSYSPSAISQQLAQLEAEAGVTLLERVGRGVRLTPQAEILVHHTEALLERLERAEADLAASLTVVSGTLRLASFQTATQALIPHTATLLAERHPALRLEVREADPGVSLPALAARDYDLVISEEYPGLPEPRQRGLQLLPLGRDPMRLAVPAGWSAHRLADLADAPWVLEPPGTPPRLWADSVCRTAGFEPDVRFETADPLLHVRMVETGHAAALLPDLAWAATRPPDRLLPLPGHPARKLFTAVRQGAEHHPAVTAVRTALAEALAALRAEGGERRG